MLIRSKLMLSAAVSIGALIAMFALQQYSNSQQAQLTSAELNVSEIDLKVLNLRKEEKDFLSRLDMAHVEKHQKHVLEIKQLAQDITKALNAHDIPITALSSLLTSVGHYQSIFAEIVALQSEIGLTPKSGLYGNLRDKVHEIEQILDTADQERLTVIMLQLRRNEKDFMLRRDLGYVDKFNTNVSLFKTAASLSSLDSGRVAQLTSLMDKYQQAFIILTEKERQFGMTPNDGKMAVLRDAIHQTEADIDALQSQTKSAIKDAGERGFLFGVAIFILIAAALSVATYLIIRSIIDPVDKITNIISQIEKTKDLTLRCDASSDDELARIALHFNHMVESFQKLIEQVNESVSAMNQSCNELSVNASAASKGMAKQLNETDMVATAITEMGSTIDEIANNTELAAAKASQTHENAQSGLQSVEQTISKIQQLSAQLNDSSRVVSELEQDSKTIGSVLDVIRGIAEQTNLLALNAAIEAARAGEQGRGFAVVADEVRNLAMRTQSSTAQISAITQTLQTRTRSIVQLMEVSQQQGSDSAEQAAGAGRLLKQINDDVTNIMDMSTQIAAAIEEQSMVSAEVNKNVVVIRDIADDSSQTAAKNAASSEDVRQRAASLSAAVSKFKV
ncbi:methyl-accepting chemotaxis sensory transducer [Shewanella denitrificans OS217]|jgi:methyl-accepting chemotaxis protein|uniref:Methyl-accepting chemotaxis sensory transducer n=1 Tax=Shewanella denitrificans (strain OS217 / ATCC BAA-1090 / DSM 15013) TaxID=318161 RepID=Q12Q97_SHEDO|nr:methyl-accepting chemotaxis protein [Shewanella denitrificans]ABE54379.1 methyl-accepting chemotaxis sensory transducer [Shewanella denitrificans OS217]